MTVRVRSALGARVEASRNRTPLRGYATSRRAYDQRRRQQILDPQVRRELNDYKQLLRGDPCSLCIGVDQRHQQIAADHIDALDAHGSHRAENLTAACRACNAAKRSKPLLLFLAERDG